MRFALVRLAANAKTDGLRVRALTAAGELVEVLATDVSEELILARTRLLHGRARNVQWSVVAEQKSELTPSLFDLEHETQTRCITARVNAVESGSVCVGAAPLETVNPFDPDGGAERRWMQAAVSRRCTASSMRL